MTVRFPRDTVGGEFRVIRHGRSVEVWPEPDAVEQELISWARATGAACPTKDVVRNFVGKQRSRDELPKFWLDRELYDFDKHVERWISILDWVLPSTCVIGLPAGPGSPQPMWYEILESKVRALVRANPTFFRALAGATEAADFGGFEVLKRVLTLARDEFVN